MVSAWCFNPKASWKRSRYVPEKSFILDLIQPSFRENLKFLNKFQNEQGRHLNGRCCPEARSEHHQMTPNSSPFVKDVTEKK